VDNAGDNTHGEAAYDLPVDAVADADAGTYKRHLLAVRLEGDPADEGVGGMDTLQRSVENAGMIVEPQRIVMDGERKEEEEDVLMLLGCTDQLAIDSEMQVVDLALSPLIASSTPVALLRQ